MRVSADFDEATLRRLLTVLEARDAVGEEADLLRDSAGGPEAILRRPGGGQ